MEITEDVIDISDIATENMRKVREEFSKVLQIITEICEALYY